MDISDDAQDFMSSMDEVFDILIMPYCMPPQDIFERVTGLRLIPDEEVCNCRYPMIIENEYFDVDLGACGLGGIVELTNWIFFIRGNV